MSEGDPVDQTAPAPRPARQGAVEDGEVLAGRYRLTHFIAAGGMGEVWEAEDLSLHERVALKTVRPDIVDAQTLERFRQEVKLARRVAHPNVCRVFEFGEHARPNGERIFFLTMERLDGLPLDDLVRRRGRLEPAQALALLEQVASALDAAHAEGIVHRDFKSPNVFVVEKPGAPLRAVVTDFGIARAMTSDVRLTASHQRMLGTPGYMAPEQVEGRDAGPAADLYALGVVAFELVTGKLPFDGDSALSVAVKRLSEPPLDARKLVPDLPEPWSRALFTAMARRPEDRFASAAAFIAALRGEKASRRRRPGLPLGAAAAAVALLAGAAWWWSGRLPSGERSVSILATGDERLAPAAQARARRTWCMPPLSYRCDESGAANVQLEVRLSRSGERVHAELFGGPRPGRSVKLASVDEASVTAALGALAPLAAAAVGEGRPALPPSVEEREAARRFGTSSIEAWRAFLRSEDGLRSIWYDTVAIRAALVDALRHDPQWPHAWAALVMTDGIVGEAPRKLLEQARQSVVDPAKDPSGNALLAALEALQTGASEEVVRGLKPFADDNAGDDLVNFVLANAYFTTRQTEESVATYRRLVELRPDLQFGANLVAVLSTSGRGAEVPAFAAQWLARAPDNEEALNLELRLAAEAGDAKRVQQVAADIRLLHGDAPHRWIIICDALISVGLTRDAHAFADRLVAGTGETRVAGLFRQGTLAILEGRFQAAVLALRAAEAEAPQYGEDAEIGGTLEALAAVHRLDRDGPALRDTLERAAKAYENLGLKGPAAVARHAAAMSERGCVDAGPFLAQVSAAGQRAEAERMMLRDAAEAGCAPCDAVLKAGLAPIEISTRGLVSFAGCAEAAGDLDLAEQTLRKASVLLGSIGIGMVVSSRVASLRLAELLEKRGKPAEAAARYREFLTGWEHADAVIPEVARAKAALARLGTTLSGSE